MWHRSPHINENFTDIEWCEYAKSAALKQIHFNLILIIHDKNHIAIYLSTFVIKNIQTEDIWRMTCLNQYTCTVINR